MNNDAPQNEPLMPSQSDGQTAKTKERFLNPKTAARSAETSADSPSSTSANPDGSSDRAVYRTSDVKDYSRSLAVAAAKVALDNKGADVMVLDVCDQTALFDYFVLATGTSRRQLHAISEEIDDVLQKEMGDKRIGIEGYEDSHWIVLDYGNVVIHLFDEETRSYYDLESLWADAVVVPLSELGLQDNGSSNDSED